MFMKVQVSSIWKKKKLTWQAIGLWTNNPENLVYHANHQTTVDLMDRDGIIKANRASTPTPAPRKKT